MCRGPKGQVRQSRKWWEAWMTEVVFDVALINNHLDVNLIHMYQRYWYFHIRMLWIVHDYWLPVSYLVFVFFFPFSFSPFSNFHFSTFAVWNPVEYLCTIDFPPCQARDEGALLWERCIMFAFFWCITSTSPRFVILALVPSFSHSFGHSSFPNHHRHKSPSIHFGQEGPQRSLLIIVLLSSHNRIPFLSGHHRPTLLSSLRLSLKLFSHLSVPIMKASTKFLKLAGNERRALEYPACSPKPIFSPKPESKSQNAAGVGELESRGWKNSSHQIILQIRTKPSAPLSIFALVLFWRQKRKEQKEIFHARYSPDIVDFAHDAGTLSENPTVIVRDSGVCFQPIRLNYVRNLLFSVLTKVSFPVFPFTNNARRYKSFFSCSSFHE